MFPALVFGAAGLLALLATAHAAASVARAAGVCGADPYALWLCVAAAWVRRREARPRRTFAGQVVTLALLLFVAFLLSGDSSRQATDPMRGVRIGEASNPGPPKVPVPAGDGGEAGAPRAARSNAPAPLGTVWVGNLDGRGRVLQVLAHRVPAAAPGGGEGGGILAIPARDGEPAWDVPARSAATEGDEPRLLQVAFTAVARLPRVRANNGNAAAASVWAVDPTAAVEPEWLPAAEALSEAAQEWHRAQMPAGPVAPVSLRAV